MKFYGLSEGLVSTFNEHTRSFDPKILDICCVGKPTDISTFFRSKYINKYTCYPDRSSK